jgi:hypothetical protein
VLLISFATLSITGLAMTLFKGPGHGSGPPPMQLNAAVQQDATATPISRPGPSFFPKELHELAGYVMLVAGSIHLLLNIRPIMNYLGFNSARQKVIKLDTIGLPGLAVCETDRSEWIDQGTNGPLSASRERSITIRS